jgi:hypothetical protein
MRRGGLRLPGGIARRSPVFSKVPSNRLKGQRRELLRRLDTCPVRFRRDIQVLFNLTPRNRKEVFFMSYPRSSLKSSQLETMAISMPGGIS